jgi:hypothetical protein
VIKYPRTPHLEGSRLQPGDEDLEQIAFEQLAGRFLVVEEKLDGANAGLSFDDEGKLQLQSRGHYLTGGYRERHFAPFKQWAAQKEAELRARLQGRYLLFGEWLYAKHTIFYDALPAWFLEFDVLDRASGEFLSTARRREMLAGLVPSAPVLFEGRVKKLEELTSLIGKSRYKSERWRDTLEAAAKTRGLDHERIVRETDPSDEMEGLYLKIEEDGRVVGRYKWVRASYLTTVVDSGTHWLTRPILPNEVA